MISCLDALEAAGVLFIASNGEGPGVTLREDVPQPAGAGTGSEFPLWARQPVKQGYRIV